MHHYTAPDRLLAQTLTTTLAKLRDDGLAVCEPAGRGERWFPVMRTCEHDEHASDAPLCSSCSSCSQATSDADANACPATPPLARCEAGRASQGNAEQAAPPAAASLTLSELFDAVNRIGGRFKRQDEGVVVDAPLSPALAAALVAHQDALRTLFAPAERGLL